MTPEREQKLIQVLQQRQSGLTVVLENVHDPHNVSAVLRSCDAVGVREVFVLNTEKEPPKKWGKKSSSSAIKWVSIRFYSDVEECMQIVKSRYDKVYTTHLSEEAKGLYELDLSQSVALLFGNEHSGLSEEILRYSDGNFIIPMTGMIPSLNISVACAVSLYEAYRQRAVKGMYDEQQLEQAEYEALLSSWKEREVKKKNY